MRTVPTRHEAVGHVVVACGKAGGLDGCGPAIARLREVCNLLPRPNDMDVQISEPALHHALVNLRLPKTAKRKVVLWPARPNEAVTMLEQAIVAPSRKRTTL